MKRSWLITASATAVVVVVVAGCTPASQPTPSSTPEPSPTCTPIFSGNPEPCSQDDFDQLQTERDRYAEAEQIYRDFQQEMDALMEAKEPSSDDLHAMVTAEFLPLVEKELDYNRTGPGIVTGEHSVAWVEPISRSDQGSDLALESCVIPGTVRITVDGQAVQPATTLQNIFFTEVERELKISSSMIGEVESCLSGGR